MNKKMLGEILNRLNIPVDFAINGDEAIKKFMISPYSLILMDLDLPIKNGFEVTEEIRLKELNAGLLRTPIIAVTAGAMPENREKCFKAGMDDFVTKPLKMDKIKELISKYTINK